MAAVYDLFFFGGWNRAPLAVFLNIVVLIPNDLSDILKCADIKAIYVNGKTAEKYYNKYLKQRGRCAICLPSTSPANAAWTLDRLIKAWEVIKID